MKRYFIDTNVLIRLFVKEDPAQHARAVRLFRQAEEGKVELITGPPVFFETAWTLKSAYEVPGPEILTILQSVCAATGLEITDRDLAESALKVAYETGANFPDAYISVTASDLGADGVATFNVKDLKKAGSTVLDL